MNAEIDAKLDEQEDQVTFDFRERLRGRFSMSFDVMNALVADCPMSREAAEELFWKIHDVLGLDLHG